MSDLPVRRCIDQLEAFAETVTNTPIHDWLQSVMATSLKALDAKEKATLLDWAKAEVGKLELPTTVLATAAVAFNNRRRAMLEEVIKILTPLVQNKRRSGCEIVGN